MKATAATLARSNDVTDFQRRVLVYCKMYGRVAGTPEHVIRMGGTSVRNLSLAVQILRAKRMLAMDPKTGECGLTARGREFV